MIRLLTWCRDDLKRGFADLDGNKLLMVPFVFFVAICVMDMAVDNYCNKWPTSLRCPAHFHRG